MIEKYNSLGEKFLKKWFWLYIFAYIIWPIWYIIRIIISSEISVSELGILYWIISLITLISVFNDFWFTESLKYFIPKFVEEKNYDKVKSILFYSLFLQWFTSFLIAIFFYFWADFIALNYFKSQEAIEILKNFSIFIIWINIFQTLNNFFLAVQDSFSYKITEFLRMIFILFSVFFVFFWNFSSLANFSYSWIVWLYIGLFFTLFIFYKKYYKKYLSEAKILFEKNLVKEIIKYAVPIAIWAQIWVILSQMDTQMTIFMLGNEANWYYSNYLSIINIPFIFLWPIFMILIPIFSELYNSWQKEKINIIKQNFSNIFIIIWIIFNGFLFIFWPEIAKVLYSEKFETSGIILQCSILFLIFNFLLQINFNLIAGLWEAKQRLKIFGLTIIFNFFANIIFIKYFWVYGWAISSALWWIFIWILTEKFLKKFGFENKLNFKEIFTNIFFFVLAWSVFYFWLSEFLSHLDRKQAFFTLFWAWIFWWIIFIFINKKMFKNFILEIKKLKWKKS